MRFSGSVIAARCTSSRHNARATVSVEAGGFGYDIARLEDVFGNLDRPSSMNLHPASLPIELLLRECGEKHVRRSGPGGQNRNKVESGIILTHKPTGIGVEASERRTQRENKAVAIQRLRRALAVEVRKAIDAEPSPLWRSRIRQRRIVLSESHDDHPSMLAEALDHLAAADWELAEAAMRLDVSASQLVKLLKTEPRAFQWLNAERQARGHSALK